jgi:hypothetical protein
LYDFEAAEDNELTFKAGMKVGNCLVVLLVINRNRIVGDRFKAIRLDTDCEPTP